jgi:hypothetical protein
MIYNGLLQKIPFFGNYLSTFQRIFIICRKQICEKNKEIPLTFFFSQIFNVVNQ